MSDVRPFILIFFYQPPKTLPQLTHNPTTTHSCTNEQSNTQGRELRIQTRGEGKKRRRWIRKKKKKKISFGDTHFNESHVVCLDKWRHHCFSNKQLTWVEIGQDKTKCNQPDKNDDHHLFTMMELKCNQSDAEKRVQLLAEENMCVFAN